MVVRGGLWLLPPDAAEAVVSEAALRGVRVLGLEGFLVDEDATYPALGRVADLSGLGPSEAAEAARSLLRGEWSTPPDPTDPDAGLRAGARGLYLFDVVVAGEETV